LFEGEGSAIFAGDDVIGAGGLFGLRRKEEAGQGDGELFVEGFGEDSFFEEADLENPVRGWKVGDAFFGGMNAELGERPDLLGGDAQLADVLGG
jgi:hypothetical protein